jgi:hypothetical protein
VFVCFKTASSDVRLWKLQWTFWPHKIGNALSNWKNLRSFAWGHCALKLVNTLYMLRTVKINYYSCPVNRQHKLWHRHSKERISFRMIYTPCRSKIIWGSRLTEILSRHLPRAIEKIREKPVRMVDVLTEDWTEDIPSKNYRYTNPLDFPVLYLLSLHFFDDI